MEKEGWKEPSLEEAGQSQQNNGSIYSSIYDLINNQGLRETSSKDTFDQTQRISFVGSSKSHCKNPFKEFGYLNHDPLEPIKNNWIPFDSNCEPSDLLSPLIQDLQRFSRQGVDYRKDSVRALPWLVNRTVVLIGDSIERFHLRDFCDFLSFSTKPSFHEVSANGFSKSQSTDQTPSRSYLIDRSTKLKSSRPFYLNEDAKDSVPDDWPPEEKKLYLDNFVDWSFSDNIRTSPWICEVPSYNFSLISLFTIGLEPMKSGYYYSKEDWFSIPTSFIDRMNHTLLPILKNLNKVHYNQTEPQIQHSESVVQKQRSKNGSDEKVADEKGFSLRFSKDKDYMRPDLIEINSGLWDLRQWSEDDSRSTGTELSDSNELFFNTQLTTQRLEWYRTRLIGAFENLIKIFPSSSSAQTMAKHQEGKGLIEGEYQDVDGCRILWRSFHHPRQHSLAPFNRVSQLQEFTKDLLFNQLFNDHGNGMKSLFENRTRVELKSRLKFDRWGEMILGQERNFRDSVHPMAFPSNSLWSQMMLWELRESVIEKSKELNKKV
ncbi:hypothetical protein BY996DRAFT_6671956 [Phakopsora pachyrhizi]|uniref:Uncharacterized protein n=1 Tax=Phakopsora pachyrhizi TaxID=170000 RepID=A0AAV0B276_PHAPC|nr:hypothetical protein BY996DRAFT_6671956 [Phakopsora pachyrhizi]CAH7677444.1 hypothetical protein PPACK8108_LOCUS12595 [Phakopsora pachyrhizi]